MHAAIGYKIAAREVSLAACIALSTLLLAGCTTLSKESAAIGDADLPMVPVDPSEGQTKAKSAKTGYVDPMVASAAEPTPEWSAETEAAYAGNATPDSDMAALITQPTGIQAGRSSIFSTNPPQYGPEPGMEPAAQAPVDQAAVASLVPQDMPVRGGINPAFASVFSAPPGSVMPEEVVQQPVQQIAPEPESVAPAPDVEAKPKRSKARPATAAEALADEPDLPPGVKQKKGSVLSRLLRRNGKTEAVASQ